MNKLYKCALGLLTAFVLSFTCFTSANYTLPLSNWEGNYYLEDGAFRYSRDVVSFTTSSQLVSLSNEYNFFCFRTASNNSSDWSSYSLDNNSWVSSPGNQYFCTDDHTVYFRCTTNGCQINFYYYKEGEGFIPKQYDSLQCQTVYSLIPIEEVTANYCRLNFDLIDPQECPINSGTGVIARSNLMINDIPYAQNQNINVFIPDFLAWNVSFNDFNTVIEVEGYNADEEYIENVINQEKLTPTNKDIEEMLTGFMTNYFPYLALAIVFLYLARKIFKLFK